VVDERGDHQLGVRARVAALVVEAAEQLGARERDADLFEGLALGRGAAVGVGRVDPPARERHVARPRDRRPCAARSMNSTSAPDLPSASTIATAAWRMPSTGNTTAGRLASARRIWSTVITRARA
jgi:hypothetical protein